MIEVRCATERYGDVLATAALVMTGIGTVAGVESAGRASAPGNPAGEVSPVTAVPGRSALPLACAGGAVLLRRLRPSRDDANR